jgi:adenylosuccinate lyase
MENQALWHERDISHSSVERVIMPDSTVLMNYILNRLNGLLSNLRIIERNMDRNLEGSYGLFYSQRLLMKFLDETDLQRQEAYELVQAAAMKSWNEARPFREVVAEDEAITGRLSAEAVADAFDPGYYLRYEDTIFNRVFGE